MSIHRLYTITSFSLLQTRKGSRFTLLPLYCWLSNVRCIMWYKQTKIIHGGVCYVNLSVNEIWWKAMAPLFILTISLYPSPKVEICWSFANPKISLEKTLRRIFPFLVSAPRLQNYLTLALGIWWKPIKRVSIFLLPDFSSYVRKIGWDLKRILSGFPILVVKTNALNKPIGSQFTRHLSCPSHIYFQLD